MYVNHTDKICNEIGNSQNKKTKKPTVGMPFEK